MLNSDRDHQTTRVGTAASGCPSEQGSALSTPHTIDA